MEIEECDPKNKRKFRKCLRNFLNGLRQQRGLSPFKTIAKFKQLFKTNNESAYNIASDLYETSKTSFPATDFKKFEFFKDSLKHFGGKTVKVMYLPYAGGDPDIEQENGDDDTPTEWIHTYDVPANDDTFNSWWDGKSWDWRVSDETVFSMMDFTGTVYITERIQLNPTLIKQSYLDDEHQNCIFTPIINICNNKIINPEIKASTQAQYQTMLKKINKLMTLYKDGVPDGQLNNVFKQLKIKMTLKLPFSNRSIVYGIKDDGKYVLSLSYINTRINHVEMEGQYYNNDKPVMLDEEEFNELHHSLIANSRFFIYQMKNERVYSLKTIENNYKIKNSNFDVFNDFETKNGMESLVLDDVADELLSKFIRTGCHITTSKINPAYKDRLDELLPSYKEVDCIKAFTQFKACKYYDGFLGKVSDFRKTNCIECVGYYLIGNIDWTKANKKIKHIQRVFNMYQGRNVYPSPELEFLQANGVKFKIKGGCWGGQYEFDFDNSMYDKQDKVSNYSKWTGLITSQNDRSFFLMNTQDTEFASHIMEECNDATYSLGVVRFSIEKEIQQHKAQLAGFIYAYQRINLIEQLYKMDIDQIVRINTDGIKYLPHEFEINPIFKHVSKPNEYGFLMDERAEGFITNNSCCDRFDWLRFHFHFTKTPAREHYDSEIFIGKGGGGKTHLNLVDNGLIRSLYVAPSYKLTRAKQLEYNTDAEVLANVLSPNRFPKLLRKYNTLIVDEASMISEEARALLFKTYKKCKLIFCGDVGFQAAAVEGTQIKLGEFDNITTMLTNYRCQDKNLEKILNKLRRAIEENSKKGLDYIKDIQRITRDELVNKYETKDIVLTHKHTTITAYNKILDKEKYLITRSCKKYSRGEIFYEKPKTKHCDKTNAFTTHSVQGETFTENIFIDIELARNLRLLYTAISRAKYLDQVFIITPK